MNELVRQDAARRRWLLLNFLGTLAIVIALALAAQAWLVVGRVYWTGPEEARQTQLAWTWLKGDSSWPGLPATLNALAMRVRPDPLATPRVLAAIFALAATAALLLLTQELFLSRTVTAAAGVLAALHGPRAVLGVVPLPEIQLAAWLLWGLFFSLKGFRRRKAVWHFFATLCFVLAALAGRSCQEWPWAGLSFAAVYVLVFAGHFALAGRRIPWWMVLANATALLVFLACWLLLLPKLLGRPPAFIEVLGRWTGIHSLGDVGARWRSGLFWALLQGNAMQLNLFGLLGAVVWLWRAPVARAWMAIPAGAAIATLFLDFLIVSPSSTETAWRFAGVWGLLLIPFTAAACVSITPRGSRAGRALGPWRPLVPLGLFLCVAALFARELAACRTRYRASDDIVKTGEFLRGAMADARGAGREPFEILIEPEQDASHLNVEVMARDFDPFIEKYTVAEPGTGIPPFRLEEKRLFTQWLRERRVRLLVFRTPLAKKVIFSYPSISPLGEFGEYRIFEMR